MRHPSQAWTAVLKLVVKYRPPLISNICKKRPFVVEDNGKVTLDGHIRTVGAQVRGLYAPYISVLKRYTISAVRTMVSFFGRRRLRHTAVDVSIVMVVFVQMPHLRKKRVTLQIDIDTSTALVSKKRNLRQTGK